MHYSSGQNLATSTVAFGYSVSGAFEISVPQGYTFGTPLISTEVFSGPFANFAWLGLIPGTARSYINGNDTITVNVVGGASSVPDNGIPTALVGSAVAGLCALRGRRAGRRIV